MANEAIWSGGRKKDTDVASQRCQVKASRTNYRAGHLTARYTHTHKRNKFTVYEHCLLVASGPLF